MLRNGRPGFSLWRAFVAAALAAMIAVPAFALDLKETLERGLQKSDRVMAAKADWDKAKMDRAASITNFLPQAEVQVEKLWLDVHNTFPTMNIVIPPGMSPEIIALLKSFDFSSFTAVPAYNNDLTVSAYQPLTQLPSIGYYDKMAREGKELARLGYEVTEDQVTLFLGRAYFGVLMAGKRAGALSQGLDTVQHLAKDAQNMMDQGMITKADLLKFQMRQGDIEIQLMQAKSDEAQAKSYLAKLLEMPEDQMICKDVNVTIEPAQNLESYLSQGESGRRELRMATLQEKIAQAASSASYLSLFPSVGAIASADWNDDGLDTTPDRTYSAGFMLTWNFWSWGGDWMKAKSAAYSRDKAVHEAKATKIDVRMSIESAWREALIAHQQVTVSKTILEQAQENFRIDENRYKVGKTTATDLLGSQTQLISAQTGYDGAVYGAAMADASLEAAVGKKPYGQLTGGVQ